MKTHVSLISMAGLLLLGVSFLLPTANAADWPQYRGPNHDGISPEKLPLKKWPDSGLRTVWKVPTPTGFSSFAIAEGRVFTAVTRSIENTKREVCIALDAATGNELWATPFGIAKYQSGGDSGGGGDGPRVTPTCSDGRVYLYNPAMELHCLEAASGRVVWTKDIAAEHGGRKIGWASAASALVEGHLVIVAGGGAGQSMLAFDKKSGELVWKSGDEKATHATPIVADILGVRQVIFFMQSGLVAVDLKDGRELWRYKFPFSVSTAASPIAAGDLVYCSAGYDVGAGLCRISRTGEKFTATEVWRMPKKNVNHWSTPVLKDGYLYGMFSFKQFNTGPLKCVELATGKEIWSQPGFGPGNVILVEDHLIVLSDQGEVALVKATPQAYTEVSRMKGVRGKCWTTPAYSNGRIYVRSTVEGACLDAIGK